MVVYRVKECACCSELDELEAGQVMLVNLLLARPCARRSGMLWRLPEGDLACTMELQVATPAAFKVMKKGADAHDRAALFKRFPLLNKLQELAGGVEGKLVFPAVVKGVQKGGDGGAGGALMRMFRAVDVMSPAVDGAAAEVHSSTVPADGDFEWHVRDRPAPGSRWFCLWQSAAAVVRVDGVSLRVAGKLPLATQFSVLLSGELSGGGGVEHLVEEKLTALPLVKGELQMVAGGLSAAGVIVGNLLRFRRVMLEIFEHERGSQSVPLTEVAVKTVEVRATGDGGGTTEGEGVGAEAAPGG